MNLTPLAQAFPQLHPLLRNTHYVLDVETLGTGPNAAIATIGCVRIEHGVIGASFYRRVNVHNAQCWGGETDADTVQWWMQQSDEARHEIYHQVNRLPIMEALRGLCAFIDKPKATHGELCVWGNGATFDNVIVSTALKRCHIERPWHYRNDYDLRTIVALYPEAKAGIEFIGTRHHALHDAEHEARILVAALKLHIARSPA